jgi:hypothetical protein
MQFKQLKNKFYFRKVFSFALSIKNLIFILKKFETLKKIGNFFRKASLTFSSVIGHFKWPDASAADIE